MRQIRFNHSLRRAKIRYIVIHDTGNPDTGADADRNFAYFDTGNRGGSADFFVDDRQALQVNDYEKYYTWHCGDGHGKYGITNGNSIGIEICVNADGDYEKAVENTVELVKRLMSELGIDADHVVRHYDASRKLCPESMSVNGWARWKEFKRRLTETEDIDMEEVKKLREEVTDLRKAIKPEMIYNYVDDNMPSWAKPTVQKLMDRGVLVGDEDGQLGLTDDMLRIMTLLDRAGAFA